MAMQHGYFARKAALKALQRLRRQRDFRNQHNGATAAVKNMLNGLEIHFGFATAGHAVQKQDRWLQRIN